MNEKYDFGGWATRNNLRCSDGRTIRKDAFKDNDGGIVPLVWNHQHNNPDNVLGHALLENREQGVYAYCTFNDTPSGQNCKEIVEHGDITALSIYANKLKQNGGDVLHGEIREVSLVLAGANPGAFIDSIIAHGEENLEEAIIYNDIEHLDFNIAHAEESEDKNMNDNIEKVDEIIEHRDENKDDKTLGEVFDTFNDEQKKAAYAMIGLALQMVSDDKKEPDTNDKKKGAEEMKHNVFDVEDTQENTLSHAEFNEIMSDAKRVGSVKDAFLSHGIEDIEVLFPDARSLDTPPRWIKRDTGWVAKVIGSTHHTPFSRVKSMFADLTEDEARAKGYIKGKLKKEQVFSLLKRSTDPQTIYKTQKIDRDDVLDITDFDVIRWIKSEMRGQLEEELARAVLLGDGRLASDDDKISEDHIRSIVNDADLFVIRWAVSGAGETRAKEFIKAAIKARKNYKGSGNLVMFTTEDMLTDMLLLEDTLGHALYKTVAELATKLRVSEIITVPVMEGAKDKDEKEVLGIMVNLADYNIGADKGGEINTFDDFDIDYNKMKYLIETRCSGALTKPFSAIVLRAGTTTESEEPTMVAAMDEYRTTKHGTTEG